MRPIDGKMTEAETRAKETLRAIVVDVLKYLADRDQPDRDAHDLYVRLALVTNQIDGLFKTMKDRALSAEAALENLLTAHAAIDGTSGVQIMALGRAQDVARAHFEKYGEGK